jgi:Cd2+/Zn2+-exporting ATPase
MKLRKILTVISAILLAAGLVLTWTGVPETIYQWVFYGAIIAGGFFVAKSAIRGLLGQRFLNINFLMTIAAVGAIFLHEYVEATLVVLLFSVAEIFEDEGFDRSSRALEQLIDNSPKFATLVDGSSIKVDLVKVGQVVAVKQGDKIPLDGNVVKGSSSVDESAITGESVPKDKVVGDPVFAGTMNHGGYLEVEVTKENKDSTYQKIVELVSTAQNTRIPTQKFIDKFANYYTPIVVGCAALVAFVPLLFGQPFIIWLKRALAMLLVSCPCALVMTSPIAIAASIGSSSRKGILIKGGIVLETLSKVRAIAFDKTRTLTHGKPEITDVIPFNGYSKEDILAAASGIEMFSSHPISQSIVAFARHEGVIPHDTNTYQNLPGKGGKAVCVTCDGREHLIGNMKFVETASDITPEMKSKTDNLEREGKTVVYISDGDKTMGALAVSDTLRTEAKTVIDKLNRMGVETAMLTGDNQKVADYISGQLGLKTVHAHLLPEQKLDIVKQMKANAKSVAMVGDGVNDAPSLALADVGIAMGSGTDLAMETAGVTLMNSNLVNVPFVVKLARRAMVIIRFNTWLALTVKFTFLILASLQIIGIGPAIFADSGLTVIVVLLGLTLFYTRA